MADRSRNRGVTANHTRHLNDIESLEMNWAEELMFK